MVANVINIVVPYLYILAVRGDGGAKGNIVKSKLGKDDSARVFRMKCVRPVANAPNQNVAPIVAEALADIKDIQTDIDANKENILKSLVATCSLAEIKIIHDGLKTSGGTSADKIIGVVQKIAKSYVSLTKSAEYVADVQMKYQQVLLDLYIKEFTAYNEDSGETSFNNKAFKAMLEKMMIFKEGEAEGLAVAGAVVAQTKQRCVVM